MKYSLTRPFSMFNFELSFHQGHTEAKVQLSEKQISLFKGNAIFVLNLSCTCIISRNIFVNSYKTLFLHSARVHDAPCSDIVLVCLELINFNLSKCYFCLGTMSGSDGRIHVCIGAGGAALLSSHIKRHLQ